MSDLHTMCDEGNAFVERMRETHPDLANREDVAAYEGQWDLYFETGPVSTVRKTVKQIDSIGILQVAYERADRALSESTIEDRRKIIQRRIRQLEKAA